MIGLLSSAFFPVRPGRVWLPQYWLLAAVPALGLYGFEAAKIMAFDAIKAPNANLLAQLAIMFGFFMVWPAAPRLAWALMGWAETHARWRSQTRKAMLLAAAAAGAGMSAAHLFLLAVILRALYSPKGWTAFHLLQSFSEVWVGYAGFWFLLYGLACLVILAVWREPEAAPARIEVRRNGKVHSLGLDEVYWVEACGNYVDLHTARGGFTLRKPLAAIAAEIGDGFVRSHRAALINAAHVRAIEPAGAGGDAYRIVLSSGDSAPLSRRRLSEFRKFVKEQPVA